MSAYVGSSKNPKDLKAAHAPAGLLLSPAPRLLPPPPTACSEAGPSGVRVQETVQEKEMVQEVQGACYLAWLPRDGARSSEVLRRILEALWRDQREPWPCIRNSPPP